MVDYSYYRGVYGGISVSEPIQFTRLSREAMSTVNHYTFGRAEFVEDEEILDKIRLTVCYLVDKMAQSESIGNVKSSSIEGYSVTYADPMSTGLTPYEIIVRELRGTGLTNNGFNIAMRGVW